MMPRPGSSRHRDTFWWILPAALTALFAVGHVGGITMIDGESVEQHHGWMPAVFVAAQAVLLLARLRHPFVALLFVVALDATTLLVSSGEVGTGTFAVTVAVYSFTRQTTGSRRHLVSGSLAVTMVIVEIVALQSSTEVPPAWVVPFAVGRSILTFGMAVIIAEVVDGRARLVDALRDRAEAAERERERRAEEAVLCERALMARELHDIAAHHLTGIIVSAQAADALRVTDPEGAGEYIRQVQRDARTTLSNLRQTVGLLRAGAQGELAPIASIDRLPSLVAEASSVGTDVRLDESGTPRELGPLAGIAAYRMVQESLANSLAHAPGAPRAVRVEYGEGSVRLTVTNDPARGVREANNRADDGYGLLGMAERAELIGARLRTGRTPAGGWANSLEIPYDGESS